MSIDAMVSEVLSAAVDGDDELADAVWAADVAVVLSTCSHVPVSGDEVLRATRRRRDARVLARRIGASGKELRRWLAGRCDSLPLTVADPPEIMRCG